MHWTIIDSNNVSAYTFAVACAIGSNKSWCKNKKYCVAILFSHSYSDLYRLEHSYSPKALCRVQLLSLDDLLFPSFSTLYRCNRYSESQNAEITRQLQTRNTVNQFSIRDFPFLLPYTFGMGLNNDGHAPTLWEFCRRSDTFDNGDNLEYCSYLVLTIFSSLSF